MIKLSPIEVLALKKLTLINHALAGQLSGIAQSEQKALVQVLNDVTLRAADDLAKNDKRLGLEMDVSEWIQERLDNCHRHASTKTGKDREGWLEDARYFAAALHAINKSSPPVSGSDKR